MKQCCLCKSLKPLEDFNNNKNNKYGKSGYCKPCYKSYNKTRYRSMDKKALSIRNKENYEQNQESIKASVQTYKKNNKQKIAAYAKKRRQLPQEKIRHNISNRIKLTIGKGTKTNQFLGCSGKQLKTYIESLWLEGMTWENYGLYGWHIDHKKPCSSFDLSDPEQQKACFHYSNLQPLWAKDNLSKGAKFDG